MITRSWKKKLLIYVCIIAMLLAGCGKKESSTGGGGSSSKAKELTVSCQLRNPNQSDLKYYILGNSILAVQCKEDKSVSTLTKWTYDERGNLTKLEEEYYGDFETPIKKRSTQYKYDDKDRIIETKNFLDFAMHLSITKIKYEKDQISEWIHESGTSLDGKSIEADAVSTINFEVSYDEKGRLKSADAEDQRMEYSYNENGFLKERVNYRVDEGGESISSKTQYAGDGKNWMDSTMLKIEDYDQDGNVWQSWDYKLKSFDMKNGTISPKEGEAVPVIKSMSTTYDRYQGDLVANQFKYYLADGTEVLTKEYNILDVIDGKPEYALDTFYYATCDENEHITEQWVNGDYKDYVYDDEGNFISNTMYREDGEAIWYLRNEYDENNNLIIEKMMPVARLLSGIVNVYEYDENNQVISQKTYSIEKWEDSDLQSDLASSTIDLSKLEILHQKDYINEYDSNNNLISCTEKQTIRGREPSDEDDMIHIYNYDEKGRLVREAIFYEDEDKSDSVTKWKYFN